MKKIFLALAVLLFLSAKEVHAHTQPGPPYLLVNSEYATTISLVASSLPLAQDAVKNEILVNSEARFRVDLSQLVLPSTTLSQSKWRWWWWDENSDTPSIGSATSHTYAKSGTYLVKLQIKDPTQPDFQDFDIIQVSVVPHPQYLLPSLQVVTSSQKNSQGLLVTFEANVALDKSATLRSVTWDFGDGVTGDGQKVTHQYSSFANNEFVVVRVKDSENIFNDFGYKLGTEGSLTPNGSSIPATSSAKLRVNNSYLEWWIVASIGVGIMLFFSWYLRNKLKA